MGSIEVLRAKSLEGKPRSAYKCNHVVNYAINGDKNIGGLAADWMKVGVPVSLASAKGGDVIIDGTGNHCGIYISTTQIIHSSFNKQEVIIIQASALTDTFGNDYVIRRVK